MGSCGGLAKTTASLSSPIWARTSQSVVSHLFSQSFSQSVILVSHITAQENPREVVGSGIRVQRWRVRSGSFSCLFEGMIHGARPTCF